MSNQPEYAVSCGMCGQDFAFSTWAERQDWLLEHDYGHIDFVSLFRQGGSERRLIGRGANE